MSYALSHYAKKPNLDEVDDMLRFEVTSEGKRPSIYNIKRVSEEVTLF